VHAKTEYLRCTSIANTPPQMINYARFTDAPDGHFVFVSFASAFLIKMLRKEPVPLLDEEQHQRVIELIERLIETLRSKQVAVDDRHAPMLYSRFLSNLLAKHKVAKEEPQPHLNGEKAAPPTASSTTQRASAAAEVPASPSIEIVPPEPDEGDADMQNFDNVFDVFDPTPRLIGHQQQQQQQQQQALHAAHVEDPTYNMLNAFHPTALDSSNRSAATSTAHPESTVHGSQYDDAMPISADDFMLAPMYAVDNPGFWDHGMMPGFSWGPAGIPWEMQIDPQQYETMQLGGMHQ
jgi:hypothetical protein